ncbi:hypothetical protein KV580_22030 [Pseudomonas chlororaphis]|nr:hypothetical protein [Pseudomonas chlororaphis]
MSMKTTGSALKSFYAEPTVWLSHDGRPRHWIDNIKLTINGSEVDDELCIQDLKDSDEVIILEGSIFSYQNLSEVMSLERYFKLWQRSLGSVFLGAFIPEAQYEKLSSIIEAAGGQILRSTTNA